MRLVSMTADHISFRSVRFNDTGLSLVVGQRKNPSVRDEKLTFNGVGKSLLIHLIHYCLGASPDKELEEKIPDWTFTLNFKIGEQQFLTQRNTSNQDKITLNGSAMPWKKFNDLMLEHCFIVNETIPFLKFRPLLKRFIRPNKGGYVYFDQPDDKEKEYARLLHKGFLLGLEPDLINQKYQLSTELSRVKSLKSSLEKDDVFRAFFTGDKNIDIELQDLNEKISYLRERLLHFTVAEDYDQLQFSADETKAKLQEFRNEATRIRNALRDISLSLQIRTDMSINQVLELFSEAEKQLSDLVVRQVNEVVDFHTTLLSSREKRLSSEKVRLERELRRLNAEVESTGKELDSQLKYLSEHGALEEFVGLNNRLSDLSNEAAKLNNYKNLLEQYTVQIQTITRQLLEEDVRAAEYLKQVKETIDGNFRLFRSFSRQFYNDKPGGLTVTNNVGLNQIRFNIDAKIEDDASDGINEVKIFCYDATILASAHNHRMKFLVHDSRLYSDMDPRQRATLFREASALCERGSYQYIATINEDQLLSMKEQFTEEEFDAFFTNNKVLTLTDAAPSEKLLGIQVNMNYL